MEPDIIYAVRPSEPNEPLRYSLRSLANIPHRRVIIAGHCPSWVRNVEHVPVRRTTDKFGSIQANVVAALSVSDLTETVVYFNDDFFVTSPLDEVPMMHGGPASKYRPPDQMGWRMRRTVDLLKSRGLDDLVTYDGCHVPLPIHVSSARQILSEAPPRILWRTWYGNVGGLGGDPVQDVKSRDGKPVPGPFLSCSPKTFRQLRSYLDEVLPKVSEYE